MQRWKCFHEDLQQATSQLSPAKKTRLMTNRCSFDFFMQCCQNNPMMLRFELTSVSNYHGIAEYVDFTLGSEDTHYTANFGYAVVRSGISKVVKGAHDG